MWLLTLKAIKICSCNRRTWWWRGISVRKAQSSQRCNISQKHSGHHDSRTSLQAVVTNNQLLAAQFKGSGTPRLLKLVKRAERNKGREWGTGAKVKPECYNYSCETGPGCLVQARRCFSSTVWGVTYDKAAPVLAALCMYISCAVLAAVQLESHCEHLARSLLLSEFTLWRRGQTKDENCAWMSAFSSCNELLTCACFSLERLITISDVKDHKEFLFLVSYQLTLAAD